VKVMDLYTRLDALIAAGHWDARVVVRGYEGGLDDVADVRVEGIYPDRLTETYYGPHVPEDQGDYYGPLPADAAHEYAVRLVGSRDAEDVQ
jgi:hypothetical protein